MAWIYLIRNKHNNKVYIGYTTGHPNYRLSQHLKNSVTHQTTPIEKALYEHGAWNFEFMILEQNDDDQYTLNVLEPKYIREYDSYLSGYNQTPGGDGVRGRTPWNKGLKNPYTNETRQRMRQAKLGCIPWNKGLKNPKAAEIGKAYAAKLSAAVRGRKRVEFMGKRTWAYPRSDGSWFVRNRDEFGTHEVDVPNPN